MLIRLTITNLLMIELGLEGGPKKINCGQPYGLQTKKLAFCYQQFHIIIINNF
jgi:hypothetical protein